MLSPDLDTSASASAAYRFDSRLGDPDAAYRPVRWDETPTRHPAIAGLLTRAIEVELPTRSALRRENRLWRAPRGGACTILGFWGDRTVHLRVRIQDSGDPTRTAPFDGRFPAWIVEPLAAPPSELVLAANHAPSPARRAPLRKLGMLMGIALVVAGVTAADVAVGPRALRDGYVAAVDGIGEGAYEGLRSVPRWLPGLMERVRTRGGRLPLPQLPSPQPPQQSGDDR